MNKKSRSKNFFLTFLSVWLFAFLLSACTTSAAAGSTSTSTPTEVSEGDLRDELPGPVDQELPVPSLPPESNESEMNSETKEMTDTGIEPVEPLLPDVSVERIPEEPVAVILQEPTVNDAHSNTDKTETNAIVASANPESEISPNPQSEVSPPVTPRQTPSRNRDNVPEYKSIVPKAAYPEQEKPNPIVNDKLPIEKNGSFAETVFARIGDEITYPFPGTGWIYTGTEPENDIVRFIGKNPGIGDTLLFSFKARAIGECTLLFSRYDLSKGTEESVSVPLTVLSDDDFSSMVNAAEDLENPALESMFSGEEYSQIVEFFKDHSPESPRESYLLGVSLHKTRKLKDAEGVFKKLLAEEDSYRKLAMGELRDIAFENGERTLLLDLLKYPDFFDIDHNPDDLLKMGIAAYDGNQNDSGIMALRLLRMRYGGFKGMDEVLWYLANLLERPGMYRDLAEALDLYGLILDGYPTSKYYEASENRIRYLKRHYINVN